MAGPTPTGSRLPRGAARWLAPLVWMAVIFALSAQPAEELDGMLPVFRKFFPGMAGFDWGHYVAYFILALTFEFAIGARSRRPLVKLAVVIACAVYGVTDEFHQSFVPGRMPDWLDLRNDAIGAAAGVCFTALPGVRRIWSRLPGQSNFDTRGRQES
jgi:VanZ family protein